MKRIYASIALAFAACGSMLAAPAYEVPKVAPVVATNQVMEIDPVSPADAVSPKQATPANVAAGYYVHTWVGRTSKDNFQQTTGIEIVINGTEAQIAGLWQMATVKGTYNPETGKLRINAGQETLYTGDGGAHIQVYCDQLVVKDSKIEKEVELPYIEFEYFPQGVKNTAGEIMLVGGWYTDPYNQISFNVPSYRGTTSGYHWEYANQFHAPNEMYPNCEKFVFNENEWTSIGNAQLTDGWFKALDGVGFPAYDVKCLKKGNQILLVDPYGATSPYAQIDSDTGFSINYAAKTATGYILLDISNPECVIVQPFINSGFNYKGIYGFVHSQGDTERFFPTDGFFACTTYEGARYYIDGWTQDEIIEEQDVYGDPHATYKEGLITLPSCRIMGPKEGYLVAAQWTSGSGQPIPMESTIKINDAGVNEITLDQNAPVQYFNLQGVEVTNPEAGELVIVKQGSKVGKTIVK